MRRYAVYFAPPPGSALAEFGANWLGIDPETAARRPQPVVPGIEPERLGELTAAPRRYGFHATLKAPMALAPGATAADLHGAVAELATTFRPFAFGIELASLGGFLALVPAAVPAPLSALEAACVMGLDHLRAPLSQGELEQRRRSGLTREEDEHLQRWGYPYVLDRFRFHLTLTGRLGEPEHELLYLDLAARTEPFTAAPLLIDGLAVFEQPDRASPFVVTARYPFGV